MLNQVFMNVLSKYQLIRYCLNRYINMSSVTISYRYNHQHLEIEALSRKVFFKYHLFLPKKLKANVAVLQKQTKHTRVSVLMKI